MSKKFAIVVFIYTSLLWSDGPNDGSLARDGMPYRVSSKHPSCKRAIASCQRYVKDWVSSYQNSPNQDHRQQMISVKYSVIEGCEKCLVNFHWFNNDIGRWDGCGRDDGKKICEKPIENAIEGRAAESAELPQKPALPKKSTKEEELIDAIGRGDQKILKQLLKAKGLANATDGYDRPALFLAAERGDAEIVKLLIQAGADVDGNVREKPLLAAISNGHAKVIEILVKAKANVNAKSSTYARPALNIAAGANMPGDAQEREQAVYSILKLLLAAGANVNAQDATGENALMALSGANCFPSTIKLLLAAGADSNATDKSNSTALMKHSLSSSPECVKILINSKANLNAKDSDGKTALMYAHDSSPILTLLIEAGADTQVTDRNGRSALERLKADRKEVLWSPDLTKKRDEAIEILSKTAR